MSLRDGLDYSGFQGPTVLTSDFAFIKATEGSGYTSAEFSAQWASAKTRAAVRGGYHFARPEESSAASQADRLIAKVKPVPGEMLCLDLEASQLSQSATNSWTKYFGDRLWSKAPGVTTVLYMGSGYASSGTGRSLKDHFNFWWYPQYPSAYQLTEDNGDIEQRRAANRSDATPGRTPIAAMTSKWPPAMTPWLPSGLTCGWTRPDIWQFTDNFNGLDASITSLTLAELAGGGPTPPVPTEDDSWFLGTSS
jgi:hypothetical protein